MPIAEGHVTADRPERYLRQLCSHLGQMQHMRHPGGGGHGRAGMPRVEHVEQSEGRAVVRFADGVWTLEAGADRLRLRVDADDPAALDRLTNAIATRIAKIGRRDGLSVEWHSVEGHGPDDPGAGGAGTAGRATRGRRWPRWIGWPAALGLAVAIHAGLIGSLLGSGRWKDVAADVILALVAIKIVLIAVHLGLRRRAPHGS